MSLDRLLPAAGPFYDGRPLPTQCICIDGRPFIFSGGYLVPLPRADRASIDEAMKVGTNIVMLSPIAIIDLHSAVVSLPTSFWNLVECKRSNW